MQVRLFDEGGASMAEVLVLFASREGQTQKIARRMAAVLEAKGHRVELRDADGPTGEPTKMTRYRPRSSSPREVSASRSSTL